MSGLDLPFKVAARIAENRTVAGVHFPVDSLAGAVMGIAIGELVIAHCTGQNTVEWKVYGDRWNADFNIGILGDALINGNGPVKKGNDVTVTGRKRIRNFGEYLELGPKRMDWPGRLDAIRNMVG